MKKLIGGWLRSRLAQMIERAFAARPDLRTAVSVDLVRELIRAKPDSLMGIDPDVLRALPPGFIGELFQARPSDINALEHALLGKIVDERLNDISGILAAKDPLMMERALSFSQEGEDLILARLFEGRRDGFFVDVGALHPSRFSNTYLLHLAGWTGINIDATPGTMEAFARYRPNDTNVEAFVGNPEKPITLTMYNEPALNTGSLATISDRDLPADRYWPIETKLLRPERLGDLLSKHLPEGKKIDVLTIDVEGAEEDVLESNDWSRFRPDVILIEQFSRNIQECLKHPTSIFLANIGYEPFAKAYNTSFFRSVSS